MSTSVKVRVTPVMRDAVVVAMRVLDLLQRDHPDTLPNEREISALGELHTRIQKAQQAKAALKMSGRIPSAAL